MAFGENYSPYEDSGDLVDVLDNGEVVAEGESVGIDDISHEEESHQNDRGVEVQDPNMVVSLTPSYSLNISNVSALKNLFVRNGVHLSTVFLVLDDDPCSWFQSMADKINQWLVANGVECIDSDDLRERFLDAIDDASKTIQQPTAKEFMSLVHALKFLNASDDEYVRVVDNLLDGFEGKVVGASISDQKLPDVPALRPLKRTVLLSEDRFVAGKIVEYERRLHESQ